MGGLGPGIGGLEYLVIGAVALIVVGPERLPGLLRQLGKWIARARGMANDFRASFDEMARQSELDDLRKEVEALRQGQGAIGQSMVRLGDEANAAFKDIKTDLDKVHAETAPLPVTLNQPEFPDTPMRPLTPPDPTPVAPKVRKPRAAAAKAAGQMPPAVSAAPKPVRSKAAASAPTKAVQTRMPAKPRVARNAKPDL